ncbi:MAG: glycosyltransferase family 4 protein, partial [Syntrophales bacterium]|nr:glycosyltransferase family 4 protein [Syntrophales bacterium]
QERWCRYVFARISANWDRIHDEKVFMHVWLVTIGQELPIRQGLRKARTALLADRLLKNGHSVLWWTSAYDHFQKEWLFPEDHDVHIGDGYEIKALKGSGYKKNLSLARIIDHRIIAGKFRKEAVRQSRIPDVIVAALPSYDLAFEAVIYARNKGIPVLVDIRDPWPDIFLDHVPVPFKRVVKQLINSEFRMVRQTLQSADGLIAMMPSLLSWGLTYANRQRGSYDNMFYLGYERQPMGAGHSEKILNLMKTIEGKFIVTFFGTFGLYHNPSIIVRCARKMTDINVHFVIAGDGELMPKIRKDAEGLSNVTLPGWLNQQDIATLLAYSHVGLCPTPRKAEFFPNKAFVYLSSGLPVISAFEGDLKEFIEKHEVGFHYQPGNEGSLESCIRKLYLSPTLHEQMSANAARVYNEHLDYEMIYQAYTDHVLNVYEAYRR